MQATTEELVEKFKRLHTGIKNVETGLEITKRDNRGSRLENEINAMEKKHYSRMYSDLHNLNSNMVILEHGAQGRMSPEKSLTLEEITAEIDRLEALYQAFFRSSQSYLPQGITDNEITADYLKEEKVYDIMNHFKNKYTQKPKAGFYPDPLENPEEWGKFHQKNTINTYKSNITDLRRNNTETESLKKKTLVIPTEVHSESNLEKAASCFKKLHEQTHCESPRIEDGIYYQPLPPDKAVVDLFIQNLTEARVTFIIHDSAGKVLQYSKGDGQLYKGAGQNAEELKKELFAPPSSEMGLK